jgi:PKD repeat protein
MRRTSGLKLGAGLVVCSVLGGLVARGDASPPAELDLRGGGAWVASSTVGQLTLIDGGTAEVAARVQVAEGTTDLGAVQDGNVGYALDLGQGTVRRVDPATFVAAPPVEVIEGARHDLTLHPSGDLMYVVDHERGKVAVTDSRSLSGLKGDVESLAEPVSSSVVDGSGRLWTLGQGTGDLVWFDGTDRHVRRAVADDPGDTQLVVIDGQPALVDRATRVVRTVGDDGGFRARSCLDIDPADRSVRVAGSDVSRRLLVVSGDDGVLRVSDLGSGECGEVVIDVADPDSDLGAPQESQGKVFIPNFTTGKVVIVDLETRERTDTGELVVPGTEFELFERDGIVFYNDPGSERAGVVRVDGTFSDVDKYDPDRPGAGLVPEAGRDQAPVPDLAAPGQGEGIDEGALGGPDQGGGPDSGPSGGQQGPTPGPPDPGTTDPGTTDPGITEPGISDPGTTDPGITDPGTGTGPPVPARGIDFEVDQTAAAVDEEVRFTAYATGPDDRLSDVSWQFSRNDAPAGEDSGNPLDHSFADPGEYLVTVQGTLRSGSEPPRTESMVHSFKVLDPTEDLVADFRASTTTAVTGQPVEFTNLSTGATRYSWSFEGARTPDTSAQRTPPQQFWDTAGTYTVTLEVQRGNERRQHSQDITVSEPLPELPVVGPITATQAGPYDTTQTITFRADLTANPWTECFFGFDGGGRTDCTPTPIGGGGTRFSASHRFTTEGSHTITLTVRNRRGTVNPAPLVISVDQLTPPTAVVQVTSGASLVGGVWETDDQTEVTFDGGGSRGDFDRYLWRDESDGTTSSGPVWTVRLGGGQHTITLTVVSDRQGGLQSSASVPVDVLIVEIATPDVEAILDSTPAAGLGARASTPFGDPIVKIQLFGWFKGTCVDQNTGAETPFEVDRRGATPLIEAGPGDVGFGPDGDGVAFFGAYDFCPAGNNFGPAMQIEYWAVAFSDLGARGESEHIIRP